MSANYTLVRETVTENKHNTGVPGSRC